MRRRSPEPRRYRRIGVLAAPCEPFCSLRAWPSAHLIQHTAAADGLDRRRTMIWMERRHRRGPVAAARVLPMGGAIGRYMNKSRLQKRIIGRYARQWIVIDLSWVRRTNFLILDKLIVPDTA